jgi:hypothetical protein
MKIIHYVILCMKRLSALPKCHWKYDDGDYFTDCGRSTRVEFISEAPEMDYCPFCGKLLYFRKLQTWEVETNYP